MEASDPADQADRRETRLRRGWRLTKSSWRLTWRDGTVLFLGLSARLCAIAVVAAVFVAVGGHLGVHRLGNSRLTAAALLASYPLMFSVVFFHAAIAAAAGARLEGRHTSVRDALRIAHRRGIQIALWALAALGFALLIRLGNTHLSHKLEVANWPLDLLWAWVTIFVVPLLALEEVSLREALHESRPLLKRSWGEGLAGIVLIRIFTVFLVVPPILLLVVGLAAAMLTSAGGGLILAAAGAVGILAAISLTSAFQMVFAVELYRYAAAPQA